MSNQSITYLVGACLGVLGLAIFSVLVIVPAVSSYRTFFQRAAALVLSFYVLAALVAIGAVGGALIVVEWPKLF